MHVLMQKQTYKTKADCTAFVISQKGVVTGDVCVPLVQETGIPARRRRQLNYDVAVNKTHVTMKI